MRRETDQSGPQAVLLQHRVDAPGGLLNDVLAEHGFRPRTIRTDLDELLPDPAAFNLAVTMGGDLVDSEHGSAVAHVQFPTDVNSYRAYLLRWQPGRFS